MIIRNGLLLFVLVLSMTLSMLGCAGSEDDGAGGEVTDGDSDGDDDTGGRYQIAPATMNGFAHETVSVTDTECAFSAEVTVSVQEIEAVLESVSEDGCTLTFDPQGGAGGAAPIAVFDETGEILRLDEGFEYKQEIDPVFLSSWAIGDSMGAAMVSWYLSYESQVKQGMFAFFFRQAGAYHPHPLTRPGGLPYIITVADLDAETGSVPTSVLMTPEMIDYFLGLKPATDLRLNVNTVAQNTSIPGLHDYTWPFREVIYDPAEPTSMYETLLRFPEGAPEHPTPIIDVVENGEPTFVIVSPGVGAYALDSVHITTGKLAADLDTFLNRLADMESSPLVLLATMPDTSSLPSRPFRYAERYGNLMMNNELYAAVERVNASLSEIRFAVAPIGELSFRWEEAVGSFSIGGAEYSVEKDASGRVQLLLEDSSEATHKLGLGRFQGFFSLDHVHLTATGHSMVANVYIETANAVWGSEGSNPVLSQAMPYIDPSTVLDWDPETPARLAEQAQTYGLPALSTYLDSLPPELSLSERCAITAGSLAAADTTGCPDEIQILIGGAPCTEDPISLDSDYMITVLGADDGPIANAAVGVSLIPAADQELAVFLPGGLTDENGQYSGTIPEDAAGEAPAGGQLFIQSGMATATCNLP